MALKASIGIAKKHSAHGKENVMVADSCQQPQSKTPLEFLLSSHVARLGLAWLGLARGDCSVCGREPRVHCDGACRGRRPAQRAEGPHAQYGAGVSSSQTRRPAEGGGGVSHIADHPAAGTHTRRNSVCTPPLPTAGSVFLPTVFFFRSAQMSERFDFGSDSCNGPCKSWVCMESIGHVRPSSRTALHKLKATSQQPA